MISVPTGILLFMALLFIAALIGWFRSARREAIATEGYGEACRTARDLAEFAKETRARNNQLEHQVAELEAEVYTLFQTTRSQQAVLEERAA